MKISPKELKRLEELCAYLPLDKALSIGYYSTFSCRYECSGSCQGDCEGSCVDECEGTCMNACGESCKLSCSGCCDTQVGRIGGVLDFLEERSSFYKERGELLLFRGTKRSFPIKGTLYLWKKEALELDKRMFEAFRSRVACNSSNVFDVFAIARHYGLPCRSLDWTSNPLIALWFAIHTKMPNGEYKLSSVIDKPVIWQLQTENGDFKRKSETDEESIDDLFPEGTNAKSIFLLPRTNNCRTRNQASYLMRTTLLDPCKETLGSDPLNSDFDFYLKDPFQEFTDWYPQVRNRIMRLDPIDVFRLHHEGASWDSMAEEVLGGEGKRQWGHYLTEPGLSYTDISELDQELSNRGITQDYLFPDRETKEGKEIEAIVNDIKEEFKAEWAHYWGNVHFGEKMDWNKYFTRHGKCSGGFYLYDEQGKVFRPYFFCEWSSGRHLIKPERSKLYYFDNDGNVRPINAWMEGWWSGGIFKENGDVFDMVRYVDNLNVKDFWIR